MGTPPASIAGAQTPPSTAPPSSPCHRHSSTASSSASTSTAASSPATSASSAASSPSSIAISAPAPHPPLPPSPATTAASPPPLPVPTTASIPPPPPVLPCPDTDSDIVPLKVSLLGDCRIGKTSFMVKYVGDVQEHSGLQMSGLNLMDKMLRVKGARIVFSIWDVGGAPQFIDHVPIACKDAAAILIMFNLTSRCTLNNVIGWYKQARRWNKTGIPILIGTKFDDFVQLPLDMQWTIVNQARTCARAMNATLFFSSSTHDINVSKIFKFITAKFFNLHGP